LSDLIDVLTKKVENSLLTLFLIISTKICIYLIIRMNVVGCSTMLIGVLPYMEDTDMTKSQTAAAKLKNMDVVLSLKMRQHSTKW